MKPVKFFKLQAKHLLSDYQTQYLNTDNEDAPIFSYQPKYIDIDSFVVAFDYEEVAADNFSLQKAQHVISIILGFNKWSELLNAPIEQQELLIHLYKNNVNIHEWYSQGVDYEAQLAILNYYIETDATLEKVDYLINKF